MKTFSKILAFVLVGCLVLLLLLSCDKNKEYSKMALDYLEEKYDDKDFSVNSVIREGKTSGRYVVNAQCIDDKVSFDVFVYSSILISDGYSVTKANLNMNTLFDEVLNESNLKESVNSITWLRLFNEQDTDYSFVSVENPDQVASEDVENIYRVVLSEKLNLEEISSVIKTLSDALAENFQELKDVTYEFILEGTTFNATLPVSVTLDKSSEEIKGFLQEKIDAQSGNEPTRNFYWQESDVVVITVEDETSLLETTEQPTNSKR